MTGIFYTQIPRRRHHVQAQPPLDYPCHRGRQCHRSSHSGYGHRGHRSDASHPRLRARAFAPAANEKDSDDDAPDADDEEDPNARGSKTQFLKDLARERDKRQQLESQAAQRQREAEIKTQRGSDFRELNSEYTPAKVETETINTELKPLGGSFESDRGAKPPAPDALDVTALEKALPPGH